MACDDSPGLGLIMSMSMLTELDNDVTRFPNERTFVSMLGLIPTCHDSGEKKAVGEKTNRGSKQLGPLIVEASWVAIQRDKGMGGILLQLLPEHEATQSDNKGGKKARLQGLRSPKN